MTDWQIGFTSGVAATLVGFILSMLWDSHKYKRDVQQRDRTIVHAITQELEENRNIATKNLGIIENELGLTSKNLHLLVPLQILKTGFWELVKINLPNEHLKGSELLVQLRDSALLAENINESIRYRQLFKTTGLSLEGFHETLAKHDNLIRTELGKLNALLDDVLSITQAI